VNPAQIKINAATSGVSLREKDEGGKGYREGDQGGGGLLLRERRPLRTGRGKEKKNGRGIGPTQGLVGEGCERGPSQVSKVGE